MLYYAAPMEGFTDRVWRQTHQKWFGAQGAADRYYAPFISPPENRVLIKKKMAELAPAANPGAPVIPQLLAKDGELAAWMIGQLRALGYTEVNLNLGCPAGTVTAKGKGSGMLRDLAKVDAFLDGVFSHTGEDSRYFNRYGHYDTLGAYQSKESPWYDWYTFRTYPTDYACWWNIPSLPEVKENHPDYQRFLVDDPRCIPIYEKILMDFYLKGKSQEEFIQILQRLESDPEYRRQAEDASRRLAYQMELEQALAKTLASLA